MLNIFRNLSRAKYSVFSYFVKDGEDWFDYGKLNVFVFIRDLSLLPFSFTFLDKIGPT